MIRSQLGQRFAIAQRPCAAARRPETIDGARPANGAGCRPRRRFAGVGRDHHVEPARSRGRPGRRRAVSTRLVRAESRSVPVHAPVSSDEQAPRPVEVDAGRHACASSQLAFRLPVRGSSNNDLRARTRSARLAEQRADRVVARPRPAASSRAAQAVPRGRRLDAAQQGGAHGPRSSTVPARRPAPRRARGPLPSSRAVQRSTSSGQRVRGRSGTGSSSTSCAPSSVRIAAASPAAEAPVRGRRSTPSSACVRPTREPIDSRRADLDRLLRSVRGSSSIIGRRSGVRFLRPAGVWNAKPGRGPGGGVSRGGDSGRPQVDVEEVEAADHPGRSSVLQASPIELREALLPLPREAEDARSGASTGRP